MTKGCELWMMRKWRITSWNDIPERMIEIIILDVVYILKRVIICCGAHYYWIYCLSTDAFGRGTMNHILGGGGIDITSYMTHHIIDNFWVFVSVSKPPQHIKGVWTKTQPQHHPSFIHLLQHVAITTLHHMASAKRMMCSLVVVDWPDLSQFNDFHFQSEFGWGFLELLRYLKETEWAWMGSV